MATIQIAPAEAPSVPWNCNVHDHAVQLQQWLQSWQQPKPASTRKKSHLQDGTWQIIQSKKFHWRRIRQITATQRRGWLCAIFEAWKKSPNTSHQTSTTPWLALCDREIALHQSWFRRLANLVRQQTRLDDSSFYDMMAQSTVLAAADEGMPGLWRSIKGLLPKNKAKRQSNIRCRGPDPQDIQMHFNNLEAGEKIGYDELLQQCASQQRGLSSETPLIIPLHQIPSRIQVEQQVLRQKVNKAPGLDKITAATLKQMTRRSSLPIYQLMLKAWILGSEPLQFKGGMIHCIAKKQGNTTDASKMRGIMLLDGVGKIYHGILRQSLLRWTMPRRLPCQFGGFPFQQTLYATQLLRSITHIHHRHGLSSGVMFIDVRAAFHSMLRELAFGTHERLPPVLVKRLEEEGFNVEALQGRIQEECAQFQTTAPPSLTRLVCDAHCHTWYTLTQHDQCYRTHRGSRPGSPIADLAYNLLMQGVLRQLTLAMEGHQSMSEVKAITGLQCPPVAWVDDVAIPFAATTADEMDNVAVEVLTIVVSTFTDFGLSLNLEKGKTETVIQYRGPGAPAKSAVTFVEHLGRIALPWSVGTPPQSALRVVSDYDYLGTVFAQTANLAQELRTRIGKAQLVFRKLRRPLFANHRLALKTRVTLLNSLVVSIVLHGAGNWPLLTYRQFTKLAHVITGWHRTIAACGFWKEDNVSDMELLARLEVPPLAVRLAKHRLLYAFQWAMNASSFAVECVTADDQGNSSWFSALRHATRWLQTMCEDLIDIPVTTEETFAWVVTHQTKGPRRVRSAVHRFCVQQKMIAEVIAGHKRIFDYCVGFGATFSPTTSLSQDSGSFPCTLCSRTFRNAQSLQGHRWKWHGVFSEERKYVYDATCRGCGQCFWTSQRLQQHLKQSRKVEEGCFVRIQRCYEPLSNPVSVSVPPELQRIHRLPKCPTAMPLNRSQVPLWQQRQQQKLSELYEDGKEHGYVMEVPPSQQQHVNAALQAATKRWAATHGMIDEEDLTECWHEEVPWELFSAEQHGLVAILCWGRDVMYDFLQEEFGDQPEVMQSVESTFLQLAYDLPVWKWMSRVQELLNWTGPIPPISKPSEALPAAPRHEVEQWTDMLQRQSELVMPHASLMTHMPDPPPMPVYCDSNGDKYLIVLHMFSGRRRQGDCVTWAQELAKELFAQFGIGIRMLCVDTAIHAVHGDLDDGANLQKLLALTTKKVFAASLTGPPCETWSAARNIDLKEEQGMRGPRPLRDMMLPWGKQWLTTRELTQAGVSSRLMLNSLAVDVNVVCNGGTSVMEHPDLPRDESYASIWRTNVHKNVVMSLPLAKEHHVQQWKYGSPSVKPTLLRALGLNRWQTVTTLREHELADVTYPTVQLGGKHSDGSFRTSAAKEYPSQLCKCLVSIIVNDAKIKLRSGKFCITQAQELSQEERLWMDSLTTAANSIVQEHWLPDYQPRV